MKHLLTLWLLLATTTLWAQEPAQTPQTPDNSSVEQTPSVESLAAEVADLQEKTAKWEKVRKYLSVSGFVQLGYEWSGSDLESASTFFIKRARVSLAGQLHRTVDYKLQVEFASPKIMDAYVRYKPLKQINISLGQQKLPFSIANCDYGPLTNEMIELPLIEQELVSNSERIGGYFDSETGEMTGGEVVKTSGRGLGATLYGGFIQKEGYSIINYNVGVFNTTGLNGKDILLSKNVVGSLILQPVKGLKLSGSYLWGEYGADYLHRERYGTGVCYDEGKVVFRSEWMGGKTGYIDPYGDRGIIRSSGCYIIGGWRFTSSLMGALRYDTILRDTRYKTSRQSNYTAGLVYQPIKYVRLQANYVYQDFAASRLMNTHQVLLMVSGIF